MGRGFCFPPNWMWNCADHFNSAGSNLHVRVFTRLQISYLKNYVCLIKFKFYTPSVSTWIWPIWDLSWRDLSWRDFSWRDFSWRDFSWRDFSFQKILSFSKGSFFFKRLFLLQKVLSSSKDSFCFGKDCFFFEKIIKNYFDFLDQSVIWFKL